MGSGWHEWPLMIFTVFGQCVAGDNTLLGFCSQVAFEQRQSQNDKTT
ncbi:DmsC/YnfH family molybdoenzyme membrane anchor subunit, partial [Escherichia sp. HC-CC]